MACQPTGYTPKWTWWKTIGFQGFSHNFSGTTPVSWNAPLNHPFDGSDFHENQTGLLGIAHDERKAPSFFLVTYCPTEKPPSPPSLCSPARALGGFWDLRSLRLRCVRRKVRDKVGPKLAAKLQFRLVISILSAFFGQWMDVNPHA